MRTSTYQTSGKRILVNVAVLLWILTVMVLFYAPIFCIDSDLSIKKLSGHSVEDTQTQVKEKDKKYLTLSCFPGGRLGNQMWTFFTGWAIAKTLGRKFYYNCERPEMNDIEFMQWMFPRIGGEFEIIGSVFHMPVPAPDEFYWYRSLYTRRLGLTQGQTKPKHETQSVLAGQYNEYQNPKKLENISSRYLQVNVNYAQNTRYIIKYILQIRELMQFGANVTDRGEEVIYNLKKQNINLDNFLCAHIRQTDFKYHGWSRTYDENLLAIRHVARMKEPRTLLIMGDDAEFMKRLVDDLVNSEAVLDDSFHSTYDREIDFYLAKHLCKTFVITTERTTFGYWLAFIMNNDQEVYYLKEYRTNAPRFDDIFPLPWHAIKIEDGNSTLLN